MKEKPTFCTDEHLEYLDSLIEFGATNMFNATPHLQQEFPDLVTVEARDILGYWMDLFQERKDTEGRKANVPTHKL